MTKANKFDLEVKGQHRTRNTNVRVSSSHGDKPMCQKWSANVKSSASGDITRQGFRVTEGLIFWYVTLEAM